jgi:hypothetical protein
MLWYLDLALQSLFPTTQHGAFFILARRKPA